MLAPRRFPKGVPPAPAKPPPPDQQLIADASAEAVNSQDALGRVYGKVSDLVERDLAVRFELVAEDGQTDPRDIGRARSSGSSPLRSTGRNPSGSAVSSERRAVLRCFWASSRTRATY